jgi:hypothetical protein
MYFEVWGLYKLLYISQPIPTQVHALSSYFLLAENIVLLVKYASFLLRLLPVFSENSPSTFQQLSPVRCLGNPEPR